MAKIAISYRRTDVAFLAGILYDQLTARYEPIFGRNAVYMDVRDIRGGEDYQREFGGALKDCDLMLAIMGPNWFGKKPHTTIGDSDDPVREELELATTLKIKILPVLVDGADMVKEAKLPPKLKYLATLNAEEVRSGKHQSTYIDHLFRTIDTMIGVPEKKPASSWRFLREVSAWFAKPIPIAAVILATACAAAVGAWQWSKPGVFVLAEGPLDLPGRWPKAKIEDTGGVTVPLAVSLKDINPRALRSIAFSRGNMAVAGDDGFIRLWSANAFRLERLIQVKPSNVVPQPPSLVQRPYAVHKIAFSAAGDVIFSTGFDDALRVVDPATGQIVQTLKAEPNSNLSSFYSLAAFPKKGGPEKPMRWVAAGGNDGCFRIWDLDQPQKPVWFRLSGASGDQFFDECRSAPTGELREVGTIAYSPKGYDFYAVGNNDGSLGFIKTVFEKELVRGAHQGPIWDIVFSPTGERFASAGGDGSIKIWNFVERKVLKELSNSKTPVWSLAWREELLLSGDAQGLVRLWNAATGEPVGQPFRGHEKGVVAVAFHPSRKWIVSAGEDGTLKVWERDGKARDPLLTIVAYAEDQFIIMHRDGTFTGPSSDVIRHLEMTYAEGPKKGQSLSDELKKKFYRSLDDFAEALSTSM